MSSQDRFGYEWNKYFELTPEFEGQFLNWTHPMSKADWKGKRFLDAGCGMGRNSFYPMKWGALSCVALDFDERSVARTKELLKDFPSAEVVYKSIYDIEWKDEFDVAFSIGVVHHLADPKKAVANLTRSLKSGGELLLWVYSYEGNEWIVRFVDPIRIHITSKLPIWLVHKLAYACSVPLYVFIKLFPITAYLQQLSSFRFWHVHSIVFDQLLPDIANYWKKDEVRALTAGLPLKDIVVEAPPNGMGWTLRARKV